MQYFKDQAFERCKKLISEDLVENWDSLKNYISFRNIKNFMVEETEESENDITRADVIYCPFFFQEDIKFSFNKLPSHLKKKIKKPKYLICIFTDYPSLKSWLNLLPIFKMIPIFVTSGKKDLLHILDESFNNQGINNIKKAIDDLDLTLKH